MSEFSRLYDTRYLPTAPQTIAADEAERAALADRFAIVSIARLEATVTLVAGKDAVTATGRFEADIVQSCAISGEDLPARIAEPLALRFVPERPITEAEIELTEADCDEITYAGSQFDLGEAVAQSLALAIDPYAAGPDAERVRAEVLGEKPAGPFAALAALKKKD